MSQALREDKAGPHDTRTPIWPADGLLCAAVVMLAILIVHPYAEMSLVDELFYAKSALTFAQVGHIVFYGTSPMIGWQILWGGLWIKLFGFTFHGVRSSMLPFAFGAVALMHACLRRFGVGRKGAMLGTLTVGFSPVFLPLATCFMTDVGAFFAVCLCLWMCLRAIDAASDRKTVVWLVAATLTNLLLGTDRQIVWLGALVVVPSTAWLLRNKRGVLAVAVPLWVGSLLAVRAALHWFSSQLGVQPTKFTGTLHLAAFAEMLVQFLIRAPLCVTLLMLPTAMVGMSKMAELGRWAQLRAAAVTLLAALGYWALGHGALGYRSVPEQSMMPWLLPITGNLSMTARNDELPGVRPVTLGYSARMMLSLLIVCALWSMVEHAWAAFRGKRDRERIAKPVASAADGWRPVIFTLGAFSAVYLILLIPTELFGTGLYDRYLLFLLPIAVVAALKHFQWPGGDRIPMVAWGTLAVTALYVVMATHDWYSSLRARVSLADSLRAQGIARTSLAAGWEYDAWTQMEAQGFLNYKEMVRPPGQVYKKPPERKRPCERGIVDWTPAIDPKFAITYSVIPCFAPSEFAPATYRTWLPPFDRKLMVMRVPGDE